jgi:outer membrane protein assembly factor BamB
VNSRPVLWRQANRDLARLGSAARFLSALLFFVTAGLGVARAAQVSTASDWAHARGPAFDGRFPRSDALEAWPASGPVLLWKQALGQGFSTVVLAGGLVYTQHQTSGGQELVCVDFASGTVRWRSRYAFPWEIDGRYPGPYGTPTVADGRIYFADCYGLICCASARDGSILWRFDAVREINPGGVDFGYAATPLVIGGRLYAPAPAGTGTVSAFCLDAQTGTLIWRAGTSTPSYASLTPISVGGKECLLLPLRNGVALFDRASGEELWKEEWTRGYDEHSCWPVYQEPFLLFTSPFRRAARVYRFTLHGKHVAAESVWEERVLSNDVFPSALHAGHVYGFDVQSQQSDLLGRTRGTLKCVELATGKVRWTQADLRHCSITPVGARFLLLEDEGGLVLMDPNPEGFRELARSTLPQKAKFWAAPLVAGDRLIVRASDSVACYSLVPIASGQAQPPPSSGEVKPSATPGRVSANVLGWFDRHRSDAFIAPSPLVLLEWFLISSGLLGLALALTRGERRENWIWVATGLSLLGTPVATAASDRFCWTVPLALFALFCGQVPVLRNARGTEIPSAPRLWPRVRLAGFIAICFGYYELCGRVFLVSGWGFLAGFPAVVGLAWWWQRPATTASALRPASLLGRSMIAYSAYFWTSALPILWSSK